MADIGLTGLPLDYPHSGSAVYTRNLIRNLPEALPAHNLVVYQRRSQERFDAVETSQLSSPFERWSLRNPIGARADKLTWETVAVPLAAVTYQLELLHFTYFAAPVYAPCPVVVTIHDVIPMILDGYHRSLQSAWYSRLMAWTAMRASCIVTVSFHSQTDIARVLGISPDRVDVIYEAADNRFHPNRNAGEEERIREKYRLPARFVLYTGGAERRKNVETLVRAWSAVRSQMREREIKLVLVANFPAPDALYPDVPGLIRELDLCGDIRVISAVDDGELPAFYRAAETFSFPSMYEGFGLTPLEAMASGVPTLVSNVSSLPEVVGDGAWMLPPSDVDAWADAILQLVDSPTLRRDLSSRGLSRARQFSWKRTAEETGDVYRRLLGS